MRGGGRRNSKKNRRRRRRRGGCGRRGCSLAGDDHVVFSPELDDAVDLGTVLRQTVAREKAQGVCQTQSKARSELVLVGPVLGLRAAHNGVDDVGAGQHVSGRRDGHFGGKLFDSLHDVLVKETLFQSTLGHRHNAKLSGRRLLARNCLQSLVELYTHKKQKKP